MAGDGEALRARLRALFLDEVEVQGERLEQGVDALSAAQPEAPPDVVAELFRNAHSLKGAALAVGAHAVAAACHQLEELLGKVRDDRVPLDRGALTRLGGLVDAVTAAGTEFRAAGPGAVTSEALAAPEPAAVPATLVSPVVARSEEPSAPADGWLRLAGHKVDALMAQAGELITASYGAEALVGELSETGSRLQHREAAFRRERGTLLRSLSHRADRERVAEVLEVAETELRESGRELDRLLRVVTSHQQELRIRASGFAEAARSARLVPFTETTSGLGRTVRSLATTLGKEVRLVVDCADVEVDKDLVTGLRDALGHVVRNAVDHGLEQPHVRTASGKPAAGEVRVAATLRNGGIEVVVEDDGRGLDEGKVRRAAQDRGLVAVDGGALAVHDAVFAPGLSTADRVTDVSGRGVGLDAVQASLESMGGTVRLTSRAGAGTTVTMTVPLSLSTMRVLLLRTAGEVVALPSAGVRQVVPVLTGGTRLDGQDVVRLDGEAIPMAPLADLLGWDATGAPAHGHRSGVALSSADGTVVLVVDEIVSEREIVLRSAPRRLFGLTVMLGTAQLENGDFALVLNPSTCVRSALAERSAVGSQDGDARRARHVLLVEDSVTTRELERAMLESAGYTVTVAVDGEQAWQLLATAEVDAVVSDVNMPRMDGIALCRAVRGSGRHAMLPFVLVTTLHSQADRQAGLDAGADAYITKAGLSREDLLATLDRLL